MVAVCAIVLPQVARAEISTYSVLAGILEALVSGLGQLVILATDTIVAMASYNDFINAPTVIYGWVLVRDMVNMVFVIILLIIAIATILPGLETYNYKKLLPKVIILAILVNFSRTICGLAIDAAQVVMLTFVAGFKDIGPGNMLASVGLQDLLSFRTGGVDVKDGSADPTLDVVVIYLYAVLYLIVLLLVLIAMVVMLAYRIVMLWLLIVLSPLFYAMQAVPSASGKASMWSGEFVKYLIGGPILAFFIWLSMASFSGAGGLGQPSLMGSGEGAEVTAGIGKSGEPGFLTNFIVSIGLLVGGMTITAQMGVGGAKFGQNMLNRAKGIGLSAAKIATVGAAGLAARQAWRGTKAAAGNLNQTLYAKTGRRIVSPVERWQAYKAHREEMQKYKKQQGDIKFAAKVKDLQETGGVLGQARAAVFRAGNSPQAHYAALRESITSGRGGRLKNIVDAAQIGMSKDEARERLTEIEKDESLPNDLKARGRTAYYEKFDAETNKVYKERSDSGAGAIRLEEYRKARELERENLKGSVTAEEYVQAGLESTEEEFNKLSNPRVDNSSESIKNRILENKKLMGDAEKQKAELEKSGKGKSLEARDVNQRLTDLRQKQALEERLLPLAKTLELGEPTESTEKLAAEKRRLLNFIAAPQTGEAGAVADAAEAEAGKKFPEGVADPNKLGEDLARAFANKAGPDIAVLLKKAMADGTISTVMNKQGYAYSREGMEKFRTEMLMGKLLMSHKQSVNLLKSLGDAGANRGTNPDALLHSIYGYEKGQNVVKSEGDSELARFDLLADRYKNQEMTLRNTAGAHLGSTEPDGTKKMDAAGIDWIINARVQVEKTINNSQISQGSRDWVVQNKEAILKELERRANDGEIEKDEKYNHILDAIKSLKKFTKEDKKLARQALVASIKQGQST